MVQVVSWASRLTLSRSTVIALVAGVVTISLLLLYRSVPQADLTEQPFTGRTRVLHNVPQAFRYPHWPPFSPPPPRADDWYNATCFGGRLQAALSSLPDNAAAWRRSQERECGRLAERFDALYTVEVRTVELVLPAPFRKKVLRWMAGSEELVHDIELQKILQITNNYDLHNMAFNPARARRPQPRGTGPSPREQLAAQVTASKDDCDFCNYESMTAYEAAFGRPTSQLSVVISNTFKLDGSHALVISRKHSPLQLTNAEREDMLNLTEKWCRTVHQRGPDLRYPSLIWDAGLHAGISQVHPHLHVMLSPNHYTGEVEKLRRAAKLFSQQFPGENYFSALAEVHMALGLAVRLESATAIAVVNPLLDMELWVLDAEPTPAWRRLFSLAVRALEEGLQQMCHSSGLALPALGDSRGRIPALARLASRGDCTAVRADVSSLELFALSSISADPYRVIRQLRHVVEQHGPRVT